VGRGGQWGVAEAGGWTGRKIEHSPSLHLFSLGSARQENVGQGGLCGRPPEAEQASSGSLKAMELSLPLCLSLTSRRL